MVKTTKDYLKETMEYIVKNYQPYFDERFEVLEVRLKRVDEKVTKTNGRVTSIELQHEREKGKKEAIKTIKTTLTWYVVTLVPLLAIVGFIFSKLN